MKLKRILRVSVFAALIPAALCLCFPSARARAAGRVRIVTTLFPLYDFARQIGGPLADVTLLVPPGVEAHSFEPKLRDIFRINQQADLFVYTGRYMEPWVEDVLKGVDNKKLMVIDASRGVPLLGGEKGARADPHIWLDPANARIMVRNILAGLVERDPDHRDMYEKNASAYDRKLAALDEECRQALSSCGSRIFIYAGHPAFGYFAKRYGLTCYSPYEGFSPDAEPAPQAIMELIGKLKANGLGYVYYEELLSPKLAETISRETGARMLPLNGAHNVSKSDFDSGVTFLSLMKEDLGNLKKGLACR